MLGSGPFEGHTEPVDPVALSLDSKRVVSGSDNHTIRIMVANPETYQQSNLANNPSNILRPVGVDVNVGFLDDESSEIPLLGPTFISPPTSVAK